MQIHYVDYGNDATVKLDNLYPAKKYGDIPILVRRFYVPRLVPADKHGKWCPVVLKEFKKRLIDETCIVCVENTARNNLNKQILPCSIEPHILPCDIYKWLLDKKLGYATELNEDSQAILFV